MSSPLFSVRGTHDLLGEEAQRHERARRCLLALSALYGYQPIATPLLEYAHVFQRTLGDTSDIVTKEMYTFPDRNDELLTLRPEGTAGIARAFIQHKWYDKCPLKLVYSGAMFRYERPQKGRQRQFHQVGVEVLGASQPLADAEVLALAWHYLQELGLNVPLQLELNTLGDSDSRDAYRAALTHYLEKYENDLSADSQQRLRKNPLRILDSKDAGDRVILQDAPALSDYLTASAAAFFATVCETLQQLAIPYVHNPALVRGLDYYSHTAFEITTTALGAQGTVLAGGRYDSLIETMGGKPTAGIGWAAGLERLALLMAEEPSPAPQVVVVPMREELETAAFAFAQRLRREGIAVEMPYSGSASRRLKKAAASGALFAVQVDEDSAAADSYSVRDYRGGADSVLSYAAIVRLLQEYKA